MTTNTVNARLWRFAQEVPWWPSRISGRRQKARQSPGGLVVAAEQKNRPPLRAGAALDGVGFAGPHLLQTAPFSPLNRLNVSMV